MKYIVLLYGEPDACPAPGTPEFMTMLGEFQSATEAMADAGILVDSSPLECKDLDVALRDAAMIPSAKYGSVEVRPVMVMGPH